MKIPRALPPAGWLRRLSLAVAIASIVVGSAAKGGGVSPWWLGLGERDLSGAPLVPLGSWIVVVFIDKDCPVSNALLPVVNRLAADFGPKGFAFVGAYTDPTSDLAALRAHAKDYSIGFATADDRGHRLVRLASAVYTPEVAVFTSGGEKLYLGRINNQFEEPGASRPAATREDLREVLSSIASGSSGPFETRRGYGCAIPEAVAP